MRVPSFARPPCIIDMSAARDAVRLLKKLQVPYCSWPACAKEKFFKEMQQHDAVYALDLSLGENAPPQLVRCICVVASRVVMNHPDHGVLVLIERVYSPSTDSFVPRRHSGSSVSEKMLLDPVTGLPIETVEQTILRGIRQETGMAIAASDLTITACPHAGGEMQTLPPPPFGEGAHGVELDYSLSDRFEGLFTFRQVVHRTVKIPADFYQEAGYLDKETRYLSFWTSVQESGALEPIPASEVRTLWAR